MNLYTRLSIGELAERSGVPVATLRAWERRHDFPRPERLSSGHRRYRAGDVDLVRQVAAARRRGMRLAEAVRRVQRPELAADVSVMGTVRSMLPHVAPAALSLGAMVAISRAIEDEMAARHDHPVVIGLFQHLPAWHRARPRWQDLALTAHAAIVLAPGLEPSHDGRLRRAPIADGVPAGREWAVVCDAPSSAACVVATERPGAVAASGRRFEAIWTTEPAVVREAARVCVDLASVHDPDLRELVGDRLDAPAEFTLASARAATVTGNRIVEYLDKRPDNPDIR